VKLLFSALKNPPRTSFKTVISQRMRELGRLIINLKSKYSEITQLKQMLKPENYSKIVESIT